MSRIINEYHLGRSCIIAEDRKNRPFIGIEKNKCPFCVENEQMIENIWLESSKDNEFVARIVNNKYPICGVDEPLYGIHDVVIDTSWHTQDPKDFSITHWESIFLLMQNRWKDLKENPRIHFIQIFKNWGKNSGASIAHSHWQIVALEEIPVTMLKEYEYSKESCVICQMMKAIEHENIILESDQWFLIAPSAPQMLYETWIIPKKHLTNYEEIDGKEIKDLSEILSKLLKSYHLMKVDTAYNICIMSGRPNEKSQYHFYIKVIPRVGNFAGFELATGCSISIINPKQYAKEIADLVGRNL
ncbi:MAG: DUF4931 domain-containing protein [Cellulosilyticaceae bacterium]